MLLIIRERPEGDSRRKLHIICIMLMLSLLCGLGELEHTLLLGLLPAKLSITALLCSVRAQGQCPSLTNAALSSVLPSCSAYNNCTGLSCSNSDLNWTVSLVVQQCTDPVVVVVNVTVANGTRVGFLFTEQGQQQQGGVVVVLGRHRNASHIFVEVRWKRRRRRERQCLCVCVCVCMCVCARVCVCHQGAVTLIDHVQTPSTRIKMKSSDQGSKVTTVG